MHVYTVSKSGIVTGWYPSDKLAMAQDFARMTRGALHRVSLDHPDCTPRIGDRVPDHAESPETGEQAIALLRRLVDTQEAARSLMGTLGEVSGEEARQVLWELANEARAILTKAGV